MISASTFFPKRKFASSNPSHVNLIRPCQAKRLIIGCNVSRLRDFIIEFYARNGLPQTPDDAFCAFVWSLIVRHPTVRVGIVPPGVSSEVWVAPQISAKRKAIAKGHQHVETKPPELDIVLDARSRTLDDLKEEHGDRLRIAVQPDAIYAAITGSHIRVRPRWLSKFLSSC